MLSDRKLRWVGDDEAFPWAGPGSARGGRSSLISAAEGNLRLPRRGRAW